MKKFLLLTALVAFAAADARAQSFGSNPIQITPQISALGTLSPTFTGTVTFPDGATWGTTGVTDSRSYTTASTSIFAFSPTWNFSSTANGISPFAFNGTMIATGASAGNIHLLNVSNTAGHNAAGDVNYSVLRVINSQLNTASGYTGTIGLGVNIQLRTPTLAGSNPFTTYDHLLLDPVTNGNGITSGVVSNNGLNVSAFTATAGSGGTVNNTGVAIALPTGVNAGTTTNIGASITGNGQTGGATNWAINSTSTAASAFAGNMQFSAGLTLTNLTTGTNADFLCLSAGGVVLVQTTACTISSRRFKYDFGPVRESALAELERMQPIQFKYKDGTSNSDPNAAALQIGFYAEDMAKVDSRLAVYDQDMTTVKSYRQDGVLALAVKAIQELEMENKALRRRLARLEARR